MRLGFYLDADQCIGCKTCVMACRDINDLPAGLSYRRVYNVAAGQWKTDKNGTPVPDGVFSYSVSIACNHCKNPACIGVCPQHAIRKDEDGPVWIDRTLCVGCRLCAGTCPHGAIQFNRKAGVSEKCDMCRTRLNARMEPACVAACTMRCLKLVDLDIFDSDKADCVEFPIGSRTEPSFRLHRNRRLSELPPGETPVILNMEEEL